MAFQDKLKPVAQGGFQNKLKPISTAKPTFDVPETSAARENRIAKFEAEQKTYDAEAGKGFFSRFGKALGNNLAPSEVGLGKTIANTLLQGSATNQSLQGSIADASTSQMQLLKQIRENEAKGMDTTKLKQLYNEQEAQMRETTGKARSLVQLPTNVQAAGQIGGTALDLLTAGSFSKASRALPTGRLGNLATSPVKTAVIAAGVPEVGVLAGQKAGGLFSLRGAGNIATGAGIGYASDVAAGAQGLRGEDREGAKAFIPGMSTLIGTTLPAISETGQTISNIRNPEPRIITKRGETLNTITKKYSKVDKAVKNAQDNGVDAIKVLSESNVLNGAVDDDGLLAADRALANFDEFMKPYEGEVRKVIQEEGRTVNISQLAGDAEEFIKNSRLPGAAKDQLRAALESDMRGFLIDGDMIPVETLHDTKIFRASHSNYADTGATAVSKEAARFFKEQVEKNVSSLKVKEYNNALSKYYSIRDVIESLNRTRVQGGRLGKYFSSVIGTGVGGMAGGPIGAIVGAEAGARIQGNMMGRALGGDIKKGLEASPELISASQRVTGKAAIPDVVIPPRVNKGIPDVVIGQSNKVGSRQINQATTMIPVTTAPKSAIKKSLPQTVVGGKSGKLEAFKAGKGSMEGGYITNPFLGKPKKNIASNQDVPSPKSTTKKADMEDDIVLENMARIKDIMDIEPDDAKRFVELRRKMQKGPLSEAELAEAAAIVERSQGKLPEVDMSKAKGATPQTTALLEEAKKYKSATETLRKKLNQYNREQDFLDDFVFLYTNKAPSGKTVAPVDFNEQDLVSWKDYVSDNTFTVRETIVPLNELDPKIAGGKKGMTPQEQIREQDWLGSAGSSDVFPAPTVTLKKDGTFLINDGNHRIAKFQEDNYDYVPVRLIDESGMINYVDELFETGKIEYIDDLPAFLKQANKPSGSSALLEEAKKYKSAEEFIAEKLAVNTNLVKRLKESSLRYPDKKYNNVKQGQYLYHGTGEGAFRRIREEGLKPAQAIGATGNDYGNLLFFGDTETQAMSYASRKSGGYEPRLLRVKVSNPDDFFPDMNVKAPGDFVSARQISPADVEVKVNGKWVNIQEYTDENFGVMPVKEKALSRTQLEEIWKQANNPSTK